MRCRCSCSPTMWRCSKAPTSTSPATSPRASRWNEWRQGEGALESVETTYRLSDLYAVNFRAWRSYIRALLILEAFFVGLILIPLLLDGWSLGEALRTADWWLPLLVGAIVLFLWFVFCPLIGFWRTKRMDALGPNRYSFESNIIRVETPRIESLVKWSAVKRIVVSRD